MVDNPDVIKAAFVSLYAKGVGYDNAQRMNLRSEISRKLVAGQSPDAFNELERRAKDFHERELDQWKLSLDNISEAEDVSLYVALDFSFAYIAGLHFCFSAPAIRSSTPCILSSVRLARMPVVMFRSLLATPRRMNWTTGFLLRKFDAFFNLDPLLMLGKAFIGGRGITTTPRVGQHGTLRDSTLALPAHSSRTLQRPVCHFLDRGVVKVTDGFQMICCVSPCPLPQPTPPPHRNLRSLLGQPSLEVNLYTPVAARRTIAHAHPRINHPSSYLRPRSASTHQNQRALAPSITLKIQVAKR